MLTSKSIPALYGGVSQQPDTLRSEIQLQEMSNCWATIVDGIGKRAPTEFAALLSGDNLQDAFIHIINRDIRERYVVVITSASQVLCFDMDGKPRAVNFPYGKAYLTIPAGATARDTFAAVTVADYTFIVNKSVVVKQGVKDSDRTTSQYNYYDPNRQTAAPGASYGSYAPNPSVGLFMGNVQTFQDLPKTASEGHTYRVVATSDSGFVGYFVRRTQGTWIEVTDPNGNNTIDPYTMPWALVRQPDGVFEVAPFAWGPRRAGDAVSNPGPSFLGRTINDVLFVENRLGFLCDENIVLSRSGDFGMFWRMTVTQQLDDDVIDIQASETKVTKMLHALPMLGSIMLFSDQVQFRMEKGNNGAFTPNGCSLTPVTQYPASISVPPAPLGSDVYFTSEEGGWAKLLQYYVRQDGTNSTDADDVTGHVPRYVPQGIRGVAVSSDLDAVFLITDGAPNRVYHYKFYWEGDKLAQSAWGHWEFPQGTRVLACQCINGVLWLVIARPGGTFLEQINLSATANAPGMSFQVHLDRRMYLQGSYNANGDYTLFDLPFQVPASEHNLWQVVRGPQAPSGAGGLVDPKTYVWLNDWTILVPGNVTYGKSFVGVQYDARWTFSRWYQKNAQGAPDLSGRLQIRTVSLAYTRAGYFRTEVAPYGTAPDVQPVVPHLLAQFTGKTIGNADLLVGSPSFSDGVYSFQVYGSAEDATITIANDSHLGAFFTSAEVELFWQKRAQFR